jgi:hypothetical protein
VNLFLIYTTARRADFAVADAAPDIPGAGRATAAGS